MRSKIKKVGFIKPTFFVLSQSSFKNPICTFEPFLSVESILHRVPHGRVDVRFAQQNKFNQLTQFVEQTHFPPLTIRSGLEDIRFSRLGNCSGRDDN